MNREKSFFFFFMYCLGDIQKLEIFTEIGFTDSSYFLTKKFFGKDRRFCRLTIFLCKFFFIIEVFRTDPEFRGVMS